MLSVSVCVFCLLFCLATSHRKHWTHRRENFTTDELITFWKSSASGSVSRNSLKDFSTLRDRALFPQLGPYLWTNCSDLTIVLYCHIPSQTMEGFDRLIMWQIVKKDIAKIYNVSVNKIMSLDVYLSNQSNLFAFTTSQQTTSGNKCKMWLTGCLHHLSKLLFTCFGYYTRSKLPKQQLIVKPLCCEVVHFGMNFQ